ASYQVDPTTLRLMSQNNSTFTYDNNGNLWTQTSPVASYTYTPHNMLAIATASGTTTAYSYDADQWRVKKTADGVTTYYARGPRGELLTESQGTTSKDYIYAGQQ